MRWNVEAGKKAGPLRGPAFLYFRNRRKNYLSSIFPPASSIFFLSSFASSFFIPSFHFCRVRPYFPGHLRSPQLCLPFAPPSTNRCCVYIVINPVLRGNWGQNGEAATHQAAGGGHVEALRILLDAAADPGARDMVNDTGA